MEEIEILRQLISYNTIKDKENTNIINYISEYLKDLGFGSHILDSFSRLFLSGKNKNPSDYFDEIPLNRLGEACFKVYAYQKKNRKGGN